MVWAKTPVALGSVLCVACLAVATTTPPAERAADQLAKSVEAAVDLKVDLTILDAFSAIPIFQQVLAATTPEELAAALAEYGLTDAIGPLVAIGQGDVTGLDDLASVSAIVPLIAFVASGGDATTLAPLESVNAIPVFQALAAAATPEEFATALGGYAATDAVPGFVQLGQATTPSEVVDALGTYGLTDAAPAFREFAVTGNTDAFVPAADGSGGYAALSGLSSYRDAAAGDVTALTGIDAFSGLEAYLPAAPAAAAVQPQVNNTLAAEVQPQVNNTLAAAVQPQVNNTLAAAQPQLQRQITQAITPTTPTIATPTEPDPTTGGTPGTSETTQLAAAKGGGTTDPVKTPAPSGKQSGNGSYSARFEPPKLPVLFGTGKGNGPDSGMRGYGAVANGIRKAIGLGPDTSGEGA